MTAQLLFTHALSPLHAGTGQGVGVIDLPVAREKATGIPYLPGSSLKGTLRDSCLSRCKNAQDEEKCERVFGPKNEEADKHAGAAQFTDQRLLLLPIRSLAGTFAWVTSPYLLQRFNRDAANAGATALEVPAVEDDKCSVAQKFTTGGQPNGEEVSCQLKLSVGGAPKVVLEDLDLTPSEDPQVSKWAQEIGVFVFANDAGWQRALGERLCVVSDDVLGFLLNTATEVTARIKLQEDTKTVRRGGLWYEEALPTETILYGLVLATPTKQTGLNEQQIFDVAKGSIQSMMQLGGKATVGRGLCRVLLQGPRAQAGQTQTPQNAPTLPAPQSTPASPQTSPPASASTQSSSAADTSAPEQTSATSQTPAPNPTQPRTTVRPLGVKQPATSTQEPEKGGV